ncbi:MAG: hypothetical protein UHS51_05615, partial [Atopobiaceae bacterium]|nr:hypothetical protein [Atopobiaceae bacterium]
LAETFASMSPIENSAKTLSVEFGAHEFGDPKHSVEECKKRGYLRSQYGKREFLRDVYMSEERYERLRGVLLNKLNLILHNAEIRHDPTLGKGFEIGHSHLCGRKSCDDEWLREVVDYDIIPTLEEYWFDSDEKVSRWKAVLRGVFEQ